MHSILFLSQKKMADLQRDDTKLISLAGSQDDLAATSPTAPPAPAADSTNVPPSSSTPQLTETNFPVQSAPSDTPPNEAQQDPTTLVTSPSASMAKGSPTTADAASKSHLFVPDYDAFLNLLRQPDSAGLTFELKS
jgi:hypothetical protein